jgi:hypothetical protein
LRPKRDDSVKSIIVELSRNSSTDTALLRRETHPVAFLPQALQFLTLFGAKPLLSSNPRHGIAIARPQMQMER